MIGYIKQKRGYGVGRELELQVNVSFDAKEFNRIKKTQDPLSVGMSQIKNVVFDAINIRSMPSYAPVAYKQRYPRAKNGLITLSIYFDVDEFTARRVGINLDRFMLNHRVDLQSTLELTRQDGHLFAKTAIETILKTK